MRTYQLFRRFWMCLTELFGVGFNESEENRQSYDEARKDQYEMIRMKVDEVLDSV